MIDLLNRWTRVVAFHTETATTIAEAIIEAICKSADLQGAYLQRADLQGADLQGANLRGAYLRGADLQRAYLQRADLQGADLQGAYLQGADLQGADLQGAYLQGADLQGADLRRVVGLFEMLPLQIGGTKHWIIVRQTGYITIGCHHHPLTWWEEHYAATGRTEGYTTAEVEEYRQHIAHCRAWMTAHGVAEVKAND